MLTAQILGRVTRFAAVLLSVCFFGGTSVALSSVWTATANGLVGMAVQLLLIPLIMRVIYGNMGK